MNPSFAVPAGLQSLAEAPTSVLLLLKATAILAAAWCASLAMARFNPRWRVFVWRVAALGLISLPIITCLFPALEIRMERPPATAAVAAPVFSETPLPSPVAPDRMSIGESPNGFPPIAVRDRFPDVRPAGGVPANEQTRPAGPAVAERAAPPPPPPRKIASATSQSSHIAWPTLLLSIWLAGVAILGLRLILGYRRVLAMARRASPAGQDVRRAAGRVAEAVGCRRAVEIRQSAEIESPFLCGFRHPLLLLPARMGEPSYSKDLPGIFAHELMHVRACDVSWNALLQLLATLLWFHPLAWRMRRAHLAACELVCDAVSANLVGNVADYCRTLARVAVDARAALPEAGIAMARTSAVGRRLGALKERVFHAPLRRRRVVGVAAAAFLVLATLGALQFALAAPPADRPVVLAAKVGGKAVEDPTKSPHSNDILPPKDDSMRISAVGGDGKPIPGASVKVETSRAAITARSITLKSGGALAAAGVASLSEATKTTAAGKAGPLKVRVVDEAGKPIAGAKLRAVWQGKTLNAVTDSAGEADLAVPPPDAGWTRLFASVEGFVPLRRCWANQDGREPRPAEFTFTFKNGRTIGGVIRDEQDKPIQGVMVRLGITTDDYEKSGVAMELWDRDFATDADGRWHVDHVPGGITQMAIRLSHPEFVLYSVDTEVPLAERTRIENRTSVLVMKRGIVITGTVTGPDGKPVAGAAVTQGEQIGFDRPPPVRTDKEGRYRLGSLARGGTVVTVISPGLAPALRNLNVQGAMEPVDFHLEKGHLLRVRVVDKDNHPIPGVFMSTDTWRTHRTLVGLGIADRTDAEGRWSWAWAPADAVGMRISKDGYMGTPLLFVTAGEKEHVVALYPALTVTGRVVDAKTKQPIPFFRAVWGCLADSADGSAVNDTICWQRWNVTDGKEGRYKVLINQPARGQYVRIEAAGYRPATSRAFKNDEGAVRCDFALTKGKVLSVAVRLPDGQPAANAEACLCPVTPGKFYHMATFVQNGQFAYREMYDPTKAYLKTGSDGQLAIPPQDSQFLLIVLHDRGFAKTTSEELAAKPEIKLTAWARLEGSVRRGTKPLANAKLDVSACGPYEAKWGFLNFREDARTSAKGEFVLPRMKPGRWLVRLLTGDRGDPRDCQKIVNLPAGQTVHVTLGGAGRPVVGRLRWPEGKPPAANWSSVSICIRPKMPEPASPPKSVRDHGPDAVRAWMRTWQQSAAGQAWQKKMQQQSGCPQPATTIADGTMRIEDVLPGRYQLEVYVAVKEDTLPWERPELLCYEGRDFTVPEIPGGVSDAPLDLGDVPLAAKTPHKISFESVPPPAPQAAGVKSVGTLRENFDLMRYVVQTYRQNKEKIKTWQGLARLEARADYPRTGYGDSHVAAIRFVFDRSRKSLRWNDTLEKWSRFTQGHEQPQHMPQILNGMITPKGLWRLGQYGSPGDPAKRPLVLRIYSQQNALRELHPQLYDFNPLYYLDTPRHDVARDISGYLGMLDQAGIERIKVVRQGDLVTLDMSGDFVEGGMKTISVTQRYTVDLSQGCNPVSYETIHEKSTWHYGWTYELCDGVWLPKTWSETVHDPGNRDETRKVTFVENRINQPVAPDAFSLSRLDVQSGDRVQDYRTSPMSQYHYEEDRPAGR